MEDFTHTLRASPQLSAARLADYMAASEQARRRVIQSCKYRSTARVIQHSEARTAISAAYSSGAPDFKALKERADFIRNKLADKPFDTDLNDHNADYVERFAAIGPTLKLPAAEISAGKLFPAVDMNGVKVTFGLDLSLQRVTKTNKIRTGGIVLRYARGKALAPKVADYQSAFTFGRLNELADLSGEEPEKKLCLTVDAYTGDVFEAPGNATYLFKEMMAACLAVAERWPAIKPPTGAKVKGE